VRLKEKLGVRSMASGECVFENTLAKRIGKEGEGFKIMTEMINLSRLYNSVAAIACARRALNEAYQYVCQRITFGKRTIEHALVQEKLMELTTLYQQNFYLTFRSIAALDAADNGDEHEAALVRLLTPMTKRFTAEKCVYLIRECMELIGGISYVEDGILPKVYRDALVLPIWEGTGNIMVLDMLRAIQKTNCLEKMLDDIKANRALAGTGTSWSHFDKQFEEISQFFASISTIENKANLEIAAKYYLENLSQLYSIALLWKNKNEHTQEWIQPVLEHKQWQMQSAQNHALAPTHISEETVHHAMAWKI
jgi:hypothetical protein